MEPRFLLAAMAAFSTFGVHGRPVNISNAWFLPEEGFPVFYRHFEDKLTWTAARDACGSHHADLLSVQTTDQADALRAYLQEIDAADSVWIGLQREAAEEPFSWTNGEKLLGDGDWAEPPPKSAEKLCVAVDPAGDFRWNAHYCGGPEVASFVCELPVPEWARKDSGCLMSSLPSLTVTFVPEAEVIQLLSDCGLDGTRRIACNQRTSREEMIRHLSCDVDALTGSTSGGDANNHPHPPHTTRPYHPLTRHRRAPPTPTPTPTPNKHLPHAFPHSPYLASERNAPSTPKPPPPPPLPSPSTSPVPDAPPLLPIADDVIVNGPSLSPLEVMGVEVELVEVENVTGKSRDEVTGGVRGDAGETPLDGVEAERKKSEVSRKQKRGRVFGQPSRSSYGRLLSRVLG